MNAPTTTGSTFGSPPKAAGGQAPSMEVISGIVQQVIDRMLPDKLAEALAQNPQGPRPIPMSQAHQPSEATEWPALPTSAPATQKGDHLPQPLRADAPAWATQKGDHLPQPLRADSPAWAGKGMPPADWPGAHPRLHMPQASEDNEQVADGLHCPICHRFVRGGQSALIQHQNSSSTCRAAAGAFGNGREPCEFCGKMLAANDQWAKRQHAVFCQARPRYQQPHPTRPAPELPQKGWWRSGGKGKLKGNAAWTPAPPTYQWQPGGWTQPQQSWQWQW